MYFIFLGIGAGYILISVLAGQLFSSFEGTVFAFFRPLLLALVLVVTGGMGLILTPILDGYNAFLVLPISVGSGILLGVAMHYLFFEKIFKDAATSSHDKQSLIGTAATVVASVPEGGYGKIRYTVNGSIVTSPAKCGEGVTTIPKDAEVVILRIEQNTYYVKAV